MGITEKFVWTDKELAIVLELKPQTIANRVSQGKSMPPYVKIGGKRRWLRVEVLNWLLSRQMNAE